MKKAKKRKPPLYIEIASPAWRRIPGLRPRLNKAAALVLLRLPESLRPAARKAMFTLLLTSDSAVRRLNHDFRGIDKSTNVLSFPHFTRSELTRLGKGKEDVYAGDIAIAWRTTVDEARKENKNTADHVTHLLVHGLLHLFGYDHHTAAAVACMERLEKKLMAGLGLPDPYAPSLSKARAGLKKKRL
jgi:probable rRNA maturation factor